MSSRPVSHPPGPPSSVPTSPPAFQPPAPNAKDSPKSGDDRFADLPRRILTPKSPSAIQTQPLPARPSVSTVDIERTVTKGAQFMPAAVPPVAAPNMPGAVTHAATDGGHVALERASVPLVPELRAELQGLLHDLARQLFVRRPKLLEEARTMLEPLASKTALTRSDMLTMMNAAHTLRNLPPAKQSRLKNSQLARIENFGRSLDRFIGTADGLRGGIEKLSAGLESSASVADLQSYMLENHPDMLQRDSRSGEYQLTKAGIAAYPKIQQTFELTEQKRHVIRPSAQQMTRHERVVAKLVQAGYGRYQRALRDRDDSNDTKAALFECAQIVESLATAKPEKVSRERYASVFPGGVSDPNELVVGREYKEPGFVFAGGERRDDKGHTMKIKFAKGYPIDARPFYGHHMESNDKVQWLSLPGTRFRFDGIESDEIGMRKLYLFSQVERSPEQA